MKPNTLSLILSAAVGTLLFTLPLHAQIDDSTGIKRAFLDRYLDCAEAPDDEARLGCFDDLLADIPAWLEDPSDPRITSARDEEGATAPSSASGLPCDSEKSGSD